MKDRVSPRVIIATLLRLSQLIITGSRSLMRVSSPIEDCVQPLGDSGQISGRWPVTRLPNGREPVPSPLPPPLSESESEPSCPRSLSSVSVSSRRHLADAD